MNKQNFKVYKYKAINSSEPVEHIHHTLLREGEIYFISRTDDANYISLSGKLFSSGGGFKQVSDKHIHVDMVKPFVRLTQ
jgi:hypothetical protein